MYNGGEAPGGGVVIEWAPFRLRDGVTASPHHQVQEPEGHGTATR